MVVVATSNVAPDDLYKDGLNRALFLPFIALIKERLDVIELHARTDYRLEKLQRAPVYYAPLTPKADSALDAAFLTLTGHERGEPIQSSFSAAILTCRRRSTASPDSISTRFVVVRSAGPTISSSLSAFTPSCSTASQ